MRAREQAPLQPTPSLGLQAALALGWTGKSLGMELSHQSLPQKRGMPGVTATKAGHAWGSLVKSQALCASGRLLAGGLPSRPQKQAVVS